MSNKHKLTAAFVKSIDAPDSGQLVYWDTVIPHFGIRISPKGKKTWILQRRIHRRMAKLTLGYFQTMELKDAREKAKDYNRLIDSGIDPRQQKRDTEHAAARTFSVVKDEFMERYVKRHTKPSTQRSYESCLSMPELKPWHKSPINAITRSDAKYILDKIAQDRPTRANRALAYLRKMFNWALELEIVDSNPFSGISRPGKEKSRERILSDDEIKHIWKACNSGQQIVYEALVKVLMLTGQRRGEVSGMRWDEIKTLKGKNPEWHIPGTRTKNGQEHIVPLTSLVVEIIESLGNEGDYVFSLDGGMSPINGFGKPKKRLDDIAKVYGWTLHDLRRTAMVGFQRLGVRQEVAEKVINHITGKISGVSAVYARYEYTEEKRAALESWQSKIKSLIKKK